MGNEKQTPAPVAWTIAGSDSGGGAGIQADLKVMNAFGVHGCSVITALTAQNTTGVSLAQPVAPEMLKAQLEALADDLPPTAIKTGMLGSAETCTLLADFLDQFLILNPRSQISDLKSQIPLICDPVLKSTSGSTLLDDDALEILKKRIFPHVTVLTPNLPETAFLLGEELPTEDAAEKLLKLGPTSVLIKGGHAEGDECRDYWTDGTDALWLSSPRIETKDTHGTGCILASAIASALASGQEVQQAVITAKTFLNQCLQSPSGLGNGHGPMMIKPLECGTSARSDC
jgi:hydroxymethylpyrimidine kinase/phosphomethylpyrimidine kinase